MLTQGGQAHHDQAIEEEQQHAYRGQVIETARVFSILGQARLTDNQQVFELAVCLYPGLLQADEARLVEIAARVAWVCTSI